jgi:pimeloyl-ACP methyl ester carboxylesterase/DNA-binding CsgD family transcriptional regulator
MPRDGDAAAPLAQLVAAHAKRASQLAQRITTRNAPSQPAPQWDALLLAHNRKIVGTKGNVAARLRPFLAKPLAAEQLLVFDGPSERSFAQSFISVASGHSKLLAFCLRAQTDKTCLGFCVAPSALPNGLRDALAPSSKSSASTVAVVLASPGGIALPQETLRQALRLSQAEWDLVRRLQDGVTLAEVAKERGVTANTVRSCLKSVFRKLGVHRQSDLIRVLAELLQFQLVDEPSADARPTRRYLKLDDGRVLAYRDYGPQDGLPTLYMHSSLSASLVHGEIALPARARNLRLIAIDRPGYGHSTPAKLHTFDSVAADIACLVRRLRLRRFALYGSGIGAAFALTLARRLPEKVHRIALHAPRLRIAKAGQGNGAFHRAFQVLLRNRWATRLLDTLIHPLIEPAAARAFLMRFGGETQADRDALADSDKADGFVAQALDAFALTSRGLADDLSLLASGAFVDPKHVRCPIGVWQGAENTAVPAAETIALLASHPSSELNIAPHMGIHLSDALIGEMMEWLASDQPTMRPVRAAETVVRDDAG